MANSSLKSLSRILLPVFLVIFIWSIFNLPIIFEDKFSKVKGEIEKAMSRALDKKVNVERIGLAPYGELILYNIIVMQKEKNIPYITAKRCRVRFGIFELLFTKEFKLFHVELIEPVVYERAKRLHPAQIDTMPLHIYKLGFGRDVSLNVISGRLILEKFNNYVDFNFWVSMRMGRLLSEGCVDIERHGKIKYTLKSSVYQNTFFIEELLLDSWFFKMRAEGIVDNFPKDPLLNLTVNLKKLNTPDKTYFKSRLFTANIHDFIMHIRGKPKEFIWAIRLDVLKAGFLYSQVNLIIDSLSCSLMVSRDEFLLEDLACFLNNVPIGLKGKFYNFKSPHLELNLTSYPSKIARLKPFNPLDFEFYFSGHKEKDLVKGNIDFKMQKNTDKIRIAAEDFLCELKNNLFSTKSRTISCEIENPSTKTELGFKGFAASCYLKENKIYFEDLSLSGYDGFVGGRGFFEIESFSPRLFLDLTVNNIDFTQMPRLIHMDYEMSGRLGARLTIDTRKAPCIFGRISISDGFIKNEKLLNLISDFLGIPSLKDIYFKKISSKVSFFADPNELYFNQARLHGKDIYLKANIKIKDKEKIKGIITSRLSKELLRESFKLRMLFFLTQDRIPYADFEFKVGGFLKSPHIKWLDARFKNNLRQILSEAGEKALEEEIEKMIVPLRTEP